MRPGRGRILSDRDYFKGAIHEVIHDPVDGVTEDVPGGSISKLVRSQRYANPDDFLGENSNCCRFVAANSGDGGAEISLLDRINGVRTVEASYDKRYLDDNVQKTSRKRKGSRHQLPARKTFPVTRFQVRWTDANA